MGTSKRKTDKKIKEILKNHIENSTVIDKLTIATFIPNEHIVKYTGSKEFGAIFGGGFAIQESIIAGNFESLPFSAIEIESADELSIIDIKNKIFCLIEQEFENEITPSLVTNAFNNTMTEVIVGNIKNSYDYLVLFCVNFLYLVFLENYNEPMIDLFSTDNQIDEYRDLKRSEIVHFVKSNLNDEIQSFVQDSTSLEDLVTTLSSVGKL